MTKIRLLHISDLHISNYLNIRQISKWRLSELARTAQNFTFAPAYSNNKVNRFLAFLRNQAAPVDRIIITGDIATTGRSFDLEKAFTVIDGRLKPIDVDLCLLPGNHDRWVPHFKGHRSAIRSVGYDPGGTDFHTIFTSFWGPEDIRTTTIVKNNFKVVVVAADLSLRSARDALIWKFVNKHGQGRVYDDILEGLEKATLHSLGTDEQTTAVIWALHFPPFSPDIGADLRIIDEQLLLDKAEELGVRVILAGHSHVANHYTADPYQIEVICAGTLTEINPAKNQFFIIELEDLDGNFALQLENYEYDRLRRRFFRN
ncbi:MAG TPA: metallophosphoesterase [Pyrinomonadaceae bacterium]|nr:metallophosphoesterase [Pyrinomonadaceae bacterium]